MTVLLDAGHGDFDANGNYHCIAGGKLYKHTRQGFHRHGYFYEGRFNRLMLSLVKKELDRLGINHITISDDILDLSLLDRIKKEKHYHSLLNGKCFLVSLHANASPRHNARGYEVYTSRGGTMSDILASYHYNLVNQLLGEKINLRSDTWSDGDPDKEASFHILSRTKGPAILIEHLFFDQLDDALLLMDKGVQSLFAQATAQACQYFIKYLKDVVK